MIQGIGYIHHGRLFFRCADGMTLRTASACPVEGDATS
jgi:hypothetical protein